MKKIKYTQVIGAAFLTLALTACGSSGNGSGGNTSLGITSVPPGTVSPKPALASNFFGKASTFFSANEAIAQAAPTCPPDTFAHSFVLSDGTIWVTQVYGVFDEIEFEDRTKSGSEDDIDLKRSVVDLTGTDANVPDSIPLNVPTGLSFDELHMQIKRLEDNPAEQPVNVTDLPAFLTRIGFTGNDRVRPSIYIEGFMALGTSSPFTSCTAFKFVTDRRWDIRIPLNTGKFDIDTEEAVLLLDIKAAMDAAGVRVAGLLAEVGQNSVDKPLGPGFLDGRLKDVAKFGTPEARKVAEKLAANVELHTLPVGSFASNSSRIDDSIDDHISGDDGDSNTNDDPVDTPEQETVG